MGDSLFPSTTNAKTLTLLEHKQTLLEASSDYFIITIRQGPVVYVHVQGGAYSHRNDGRPAWAVTPQRVD